MNLCEFLSGHNCHLPPWARAVSPRNSSSYTPILKSDLRVTSLNMDNSNNHRHSSCHWTIRKKYYFQYMNTNLKKKSCFKQWNENRVVLTRHHRKQSFNLWSSPLQILLKIMAALVQINRGFCPQSIVYGSIWKRKDIIWIFSFRPVWSNIAHSPWKHNFSLPFHARFYLHVVDSRKSLSFWLEVGFQSPFHFHGRI